ncbi:hypothetical protein HPP92_028516 [Vanilla planifolia]|uniref:Uncharacterized protein n=1 Tax=Vanilla planifolia TaxID=51239 RepID=A0A835U5N2_VANPL|nr:hypothetical protein HPP92_028516 [Vanilla planifolia]
MDVLEDDACRNDSDEDGSDDGELANVCDTEELNEEIEVQAIRIDGQDEDANDGKDPSNRKKRKLGNSVEFLNATYASPRSLKRLARIKVVEVSTDEADGSVDINLVAFLNLIIVVHIDIKSSSCCLMNCTISKQELGKTIAGLRASRPLWHLTMETKNTKRWEPARRLLGRDRNRT